MSAHTGQGLEPWDPCEDWPGRQVAGLGTEMWHRPTLVLAASDTSPAQNSAWANGGGQPPGPPDHSGVLSSGMQEGGLGKDEMELGQQEGG